MNSEQLLARTLTRQAISSPLARPKSVFDRLVGIQAQYIASVPQAVFARCPNVDPNWFERAMDRDRSIAKAWNLRSTVHVTTSQDHALLTHSVYLPILNITRHSWSEGEGVAPRDSRRWMPALSAHSGTGH